MRNIDTYDIAKSAKKAGFNEKQTDFFIKTVNQIEDSSIASLATKEDIKALDTKIDHIHLATKEDIKAVRSDLQKEIKIAMLTTIISLGAIMGISQINSFG